MNNAVILRENIDGIEILTINRPEKLNALNNQVMDELDRAVGEIESRPEIKALILTGAGEKSFVAGADISQFPAFTPRDGKAMSLRGQQILNRIENLPFPVIAAINGLALGGGLELAMACHIRIAAAGARVGQPEVKLGIIPGYAGTQRLSRIVGKGRALEMIMRGNMVSAEEALQMGLVNHVVPPENLREESLKIAREIAGNGRLAVQATIEAVNHGLNLTFEEASTLEANLFALLFSTEDQKEGARAFLEKRPPKFTNR